MFLAFKILEKNFIDYEEYVVIIDDEVGEFTPIDCNDSLTFEDKLVYSYEEICNNNIDFIVKNIYRFFYYEWKNHAVGYSFKNFLIDYAEFSVEEHKKYTNLILKLYEEIENFL